MDEMSVGVVVDRAAPAPHRGGGTAPKDLREWMTRVEALGQLTRITHEVDWDEEMGAITHMAHQTIGAPTLLFERIKDSPPGFQALWNMIGSSLDRFALAIGESPGL